MDGPVEIAVMLGVQNWRIWPSLCGVLAILFVWILATVVSEFLVGPKCQTQSLFHLDVAVKLAEYLL